MNITKLWATWSLSVSFSQLHRLSLQGFVSVFFMHAWKTLRLWSLGLFVPWMVESLYKKSPEGYGAPFSAMKSYEVLHVA